MKRKNLLKTLLALSLLMTVVPVSNLHAQETKNVSVKLLNYLGNKTSLSITIKGVYYIEEEPSIELDSSYQLYLQNKTLKLEGDGINKDVSSSFVLKPKVYGTEHVIQINGKDYLGDMKFSIEGGYIRPINTLSVEDYLKGVVSKEMPTSWHIEALKAQAVAARTYTEDNLSSVISDTQTHQVYGGYDWSVNATKAVEETKGEILTYNGKPIHSFYSSSNGGAIESNTGAWGSSLIPYLQSKPDPFDPQTAFSYTVSEGVLISAVRDSTNGVSIKSIDSIVVKNRTEAGYAKEMTLYVNGNDTKIDVKASLLRARLDGMQLKSTNIERVTKTGNQFTFQGKGFGHGVGMSQYGAKAMAEKNYSYKEILGFYYQGSTLETLLGGEKLSSSVQGETKTSPTIKQESSIISYEEVQNIMMEYQKEETKVSHVKIDMKEQMLRLSFKMKEDADIYAVLIDANQNKTIVKDDKKTKGTIIFFYDTKPMKNGIYTLQVRVTNKEGQQTQFSNLLSIGQGMPTDILLSKMNSLHYE